MGPSEPRAVAETALRPGRHCLHRQQRYVTDWVGTDSARHPRSVEQTTAESRCRIRMGPTTPFRDPIAIQRAAPPCRASQRPLHMLW
ncbi:hypothetical protein NDU88_004537 [Pleurodeles waltl]|uniref:Uncharacterized protein n=1 Tax=Pleurodeles waltl TaxID=8319 RepID=A0AAV7VJ35_PLEWA|nr:hypothetical protein NDU88_004537 [Pleurodeles waltl]